MRQIGLDSLIDGETYGDLAPHQLEWLDACLSEGDGKPTMVFVHHPPFLTGISAMDDLWLRSGDALGRVLARHTGVLRLLAGHYHRPITAMFGGTLAFCAPSIAHQVALDLTPGQPTRLIMEPPALAVHTWRPDIGMTTHLTPIRDYGPRFDVVLEADYREVHACSSMLSPMSLLHGAERIVDAAAAQLVAMQNGPLVATRKELRDIVTEADLASEKIVIDGLKALTPRAAILAEESGLSGAASGPRWIIDPLDGTINYASGLPWFSVTVAYHDGHEIIVGLTKAPVVGLMARYARGLLSTINDQPAQVSGTRFIRCDCR